MDAKKRQRLSWRVAHLPELEATRNQAIQVVAAQCTWRRAARELYRLLVRQPAKKNRSAENQAQTHVYSGRSACRHAKQH